MKKFLLLILSLGLVNPLVASEESSKYKYSMSYVTGTLEKMRVIRRVHSKYSFMCAHQECARIPLFHILSSAVEHFLKKHTQQSEEHIQSVIRKHDAKLRKEFDIPEYDPETDPKGAFQGDSGDLLGERVSCDKHQVVRKKTNDSLKKMKIIEQLRERDEKGNKFRCMKCDRFFLELSNTYDHYMARHTTARSFVCLLPGCSKDYYSKDALKKHMQSSHLKEWNEFLKSLTQEDPFRSRPKYEIPEYDSDNDPTNKDPKKTQRGSEVRGKKRKRTNQLLVPHESDEDKNEEGRMVRQRTTSLPSAITTTTITTTTTSDELESDGLQDMEAANALMTLFESAGRGITPKVDASESAPMDLDGEYDSDVTIIDDEKEGYI